MECPKCHHEFTPTRAELASERGKLGKGKRKTISKAESKRRAARLAKAREKRHAKP